MRKIAFALAGAAALALGSTAANATALVLTTTTTPSVTPPQSGTFGNSFNPASPGLFTDVYNFTLTGNSLANGSLISVSLAGGNTIDFTCQTCSVLMDGTAFTLQSQGNLDVFTLDPLSLSTGPHAITINGNITSGPTASYSGTVNFNLPLPEPATWAMMLLGFAGIGLAMRSRRRPVLAQVA